VERVSDVQRAIHRLVFFEGTADVARTRKVVRFLAVVGAAADAGAFLAASGTPDQSTSRQGAADVLQRSVDLLKYFSRPERAVDVHPLVVAAVDEAPLLERRELAFALAEAADAAVRLRVAAAVEVVVAHLRDALLYEPLDGVGEGRRLVEGRQRRLMLHHRPLQRFARAAGFSPVVRNVRVLRVEPRKHLVEGVVVQVTELLRLRLAHHSIHISMKFQNGRILVRIDFLLDLEERRNR